MQHYANITILLGRARGDSNCPFGLVQNRPSEGNLSRVWRWCITTAFSTASWVMIATVPCWDSPVVSAHGSCQGAGCNPWGPCLMTSCWHKHFQNTSKQEWLAGSRNKARLETKTARAETVKLFHLNYQLSGEAGCHDHVRMHGSFRSF